MAAQSAASSRCPMRLLLKRVRCDLGFASLLAFWSSQEVSKRTLTMTASLSMWLSGSVLAVRDTTIDGLEIHENIIPLVWLMVRSLCLHQIWTLLEHFRQDDWAKTVKLLWFTSAKGNQDQAQALGRIGWRYWSWNLPGDNQFIHTSLVLNNIEIII